MKRILFSLACMVLGLCHACPQQGTGSLTFSSPVSSDDATLGRKRASVVFITPYEGFTIVAIDKRDLVMKSMPQKDGTCAIQVMCDLSDPAADRNHNFRVNIAGTALGDYVKVPLVAGKRFTIQVKQALEHDLYFNYPNTQRAYTDASKSAIEFSVPDYIKNPKVEFSKGIGRLLPQASGSGMNTITLEIDCENLKKLRAEIPIKRAEAEAHLKKLQAGMAELEKNFDEHSSDSDFNFEDYEKRRAELEEAIEHVFDDVPEVIVVLYADKSNVVHVERQRLAGLTEPRQRLQINVGDGMHKETIYKEASFEELLTTARQYYKDYPHHSDFNFFEGANIAYKNAINHNDCPIELREEIRKEHDSLLSIRKDIYLIEQTSDRVAQAEEKEGFNSDGVYKYLSAQINFANRILKNHLECSAIEQLRDSLLTRISSHPKASVEAGTETVTHKRDKLSGSVSFKNKYMAIQFENMRVYAIPTKQIKGTKSRIIGRVNADGTYDVVKPDGLSSLYIYVTGEKDEAHYVPNGTTHLDIIVK